MSNLRREFLVIIELSGFGCHGGKEFTVSTMASLRIFTIQVGSDALPLIHYNLVEVRVCWLWFRFGREG